MQGTISKWGNSLGVRIPRQIAEGAKLREGTPVDLKVEDGALIIKPARKRFKLADLLAQPAPKAEETDWGQPEGEEAW